MFQLHDARTVLHEIAKFLKNLIISLVFTGTPYNFQH